MTAQAIDDPALGEQASAETARSRTAPRWAAAGIVLVLVAGLVLRLHSPSALWLDEAISANISRLPLAQVPQALREDGAPPLYAFLLWGWERLFGDSAEAVRSLSAVFGILAVAVAWLAGSRLAGRAAGLAAMLLMATSPFAVYYSSEARMYSLVTLLVLGGTVALVDYLRAPRAWRGALLAALTAALALTHYWGLFLIAVVAGGLVGRALWSRSGRPVVAVGWMAAGGLLFLPWLPTFLFQAAHTGTPWGLPAGYDAVLTTVYEWSGGTGSLPRLLALLLLLLAGVGVCGVAAMGWRLQLDLRGRPPGRALALAVLATLILALTVGRVTGAAFTPRYTSVVLPLFLLVAAIGAARLPPAGRAGVLAVAAVAGLLACVPDATFGGKTQAPVIAAALRSQALPGDLVVYCPDQLGPDTSRLLPRRLHQEVYPTGGSPARVDWVDYAQRNAAADPVAFARQVSDQAGAGVVWMVDNVGYRTLEGQCEAVRDELTALRGSPTVLVDPDTSYFEPAQLVGWPARAPSR